MNMEFMKYLKSIFCLMVFSFTSCATISPYNSVAYEQATSLKVESIQLMSEAVNAFDNHKDDVDELKTRIEKAYEYAKGRPRNEISTKQWWILKDSERHLLGGFLKRWKEKSVLSETFINGAKKNVSQAFDTIIELESGKLKPKDVKSE